QQIQKESGCLSPTALAALADYFALPPSEVYEVITFYPDFRLTAPGKKQIKICMGTACHLKGSKIIQEQLESKLSIKCGETTPDGQYSLERVACVGCCSLAPVIVFNQETIPQVSLIRIEELTREGRDQD
ncbi:MAG: NAD(P)H-dependent oxidoreductase subunit E, partial [Clostridia bacterium]|nr:NAD(P)H-dependent oxidoreductase subunit E [Clostridia bacterium]